LFESYQKIARQYKSPPLKYERKLISLAKRGKTSAIKELLFYQIRFFIFRIKTVLYPKILSRYGDDVLQNCIMFAMIKISSYNMKYKNKQGKLQPVYFRTYLWKGITGVIINSVKRKKEICFSDLSDLRIKQYK